jgi:hypothetical protein
MQIETVTQIHESYQRLGPFERVCIERWRALNPGVKYQFITDKDIDPWVKQRWPQHADTYDSMLPICRAGVQRLSSVLRWGGLYVDCGTYPVRPISEFKPEDIWERDLVMFRLQDRRDPIPIITDCMFAAVEGHPFIHGLVSEIFRRTEDTSYASPNVRRFVFDTASVHVFSEYANEQGVEGVRALADATHVDIDERIDAINTMRYSTESWVPNNRFKRDGIDRFKDEMYTLEVMKHHFGI